MKNEAEVIHEAREYQETHDWIQHAVGNHSGGVCMWGSLLVSQGYPLQGCTVTGENALLDPTIRKVLRIVASLLPPPFRCPTAIRSIEYDLNDITGWNDYDYREKQEVLDLWGKAEKIALGMDPDAA